VKEEGAMATDIVWFLTKLRDYLMYVSPPVVGVIVGGVVIQRYWISRANESTLIKYLAKELDDLVDETLEYWSLDCSGDKKIDEENRQRARMLEQRIKGAIRNLNAALIRYSRRYCKNVDFTSLMVEVSDACTGDEFETVTKRGPDRGRYLTVVNAAHHVRWQLFARLV
jgi:hypothetical protein